MKPEFVDNNNGNLMMTALRGHLEWLAQTYREPVTVSIATGYFNPEGFALIAKYLETTAGVRLLLGAEPSTPPLIPRRKPGDKRGKAYNAERVKKALAENEEGLKADRDILGFSRDVDDKIQHLLDFLDSGKIEVRRYTQGFLHGKAFIFSNDEGVIAGSSNFTAAGLTGNLELNLGHYQPSVVRQVKGWFDQLWEDAEPYDLANIYAARYVEFDPYLIYLRVLFELYGKEIEEEKLTTRLPLTTFQTDGIYRAKRILEQYNGVIVADGVGLGKTFIGGEILREVVEEHRQRALLISPAVLRDGTWDRFQHNQQIYFEKISYEQLVAESQLGGDQSILREDIRNYSLVVIDEAHAFRNPDTRRSQALRLLLRGTPPKKLILMTATPVNNSLWDLYSLLTYFIGHDAVFADRGIRSLKEHFHDVVSQDPYSLRPDILFDVLDATTVRRTRHFVQKYYPHDHVRDLTGNEVPIRFPESHVLKVNYELDEVLPDFFEEFAAALAPEEGEPELTLARYWPSRYKMNATPEEQIREAALVGLLRSGLLKRFESSVYAFAETASRMANTHDAFLAALNQGYIPAPEAILEWGEVDNDEAFAALLAEGGSLPSVDYNVDQLRRDVEHDRDLLRYFANRARSISRTNDPKLKQLVDELAEIAAQAQHEYLDERDYRNKRKVIVFSYFSDTVYWIEEFLAEQVRIDPRLAVYADRVASVSSKVSGGVSRDEAVFGFAPETTFAPPGRSMDRFDILVTTDVLAEGENLQQCRNIINYDLPWNPMRLVQRNGRIDRIGSPHKDVYIRCFFPDQRLDTLLTLEERIRVKLAQAAASIGVESEVIPAGAVHDVVFAETREQITALQKEEADILKTAGEEPNAYSGEEYRQELRRGLERRREEIAALPWAAGSGFVGGLRTGYFFCAVVGESTYLRFLPVAGEIIRDTLSCLKFITCTSTTPRNIPVDMLNGVYDAWLIARKDIFEQWDYATDPANLQPRIRPLFREIANHLRQFLPTGITQEELGRILDAVEAPWGFRIEKALRQVFDRDATDKWQLSQQIVEKVVELGLQPFIPPDPLPVIEEEEVQLICWIVVEN